MPLEPIVYHDEVLRSGAESFAVLIPTSFVEATFHEAMVVVEMSNALMMGILVRLAVANNSRAGQHRVALPMLLSLIEGPAWLAPDARLNTDIQLHAWRGGLQCNVKARIAPASTLEVTPGRRKVERRDVSTWVSILPMQGASVEVTPHAKYTPYKEGAQGVGMFTAATVAAHMQILSRCAGNK